jgi:hypothetical protein
MIYYCLSISYSCISAFYFAFSFCLYFSLMISDALFLVSSIFFHVLISSCLSKAIRLANNEASRSTLKLSDHCLLHAFLLCYECRFIYWLRFTSLRIIRFIAVHFLGLITILDMWKLRIVVVLVFAHFGKLV